MNPADSDNLSSIFSPDKRGKIRVDLRVICSSINKSPHLSPSPVSEYNHPVDVC